MVITGMRMVLKAAERERVGVLKCGKEKKKRGSMHLFECAYALKSKCMHVHPQ